MDLKLREPADDCDRKLLADVKDYGWHMVIVPDHEEGPGFVFTVGAYYSYGHPEILAMGLPLEVGPQLLTAAMESVAGGTIYYDGATDNEIANMPSRFRRVDVCHFRDYLGYAEWFYRNLDHQFPALRLVWPDRDGLFPEEDGYDSRFYSKQRPLWKPE